MYQMYLQSPPFPPAGRSIVNKNLFLITWLNKDLSQWKKGISVTFSAEMWNNVLQTIMDVHPIECHWWKDVNTLRVNMDQYVRLTQPIIISVSVLSIEIPQEWKVLVWLLCFALQKMCAKTNIWRNHHLWCHKGLWYQIPISKHWFWFCTGI